MVHHDVFRPNGCEAITRKVPDTLGESRVEGIEQEVVPVVDDQLFCPVEPGHTVENEHIFFVDADLLGDESAQIGRHLGVDGQADDRAAASTLERGFEQPHQILRLLQNLDVTIANDPERPHAAQLETREDPVEEHGDAFLEQDEPLITAGQADETLDLSRQGQEADHQPVVARPVKLQRFGQPEIRDERERVCRIDGEWSQDREDRGHKPVFEPGRLIRGELVRLYHGDILRPQRVHQPQPCLLLRGHEGARARIDRRELLAWGQPFLAGCCDSGLDLALKAGHAHHVELVQVRRGDRQETQTFEQRMIAILRLFEDTLVEREPGEFAVDEPFGRIRPDPGDRVGDHCVVFSDHGDHVLVRNYRRIHAA